MSVELTSPAPPGKQPPSRRKERGTEQHIAKDIHPADYSCDSLALSSPRHQLQHQHQEADDYGGDTEICNDRPEKGGQSPVRSPDHRLEALGDGKVSLTTFTKRKELALNRRDVRTVEVEQGLREGEKAQQTYHGQRRSPEDGVWHRLASVPTRWEKASTPRVLKTLCRDEPRCCNDVGNARSNDRQLYL